MSVRTEVRAQSKLASGSQNTQNTSARRERGRLQDIECPTLYPIRGEVSSVCHRDIFQQVINEEVQHPGYMFHILSRKQLKSVQTHLIDILGSSPLLSSVILKQKHILTTIRSRDRRKIIHNNSD